jgi:hypothetical protein
MIYEQRSAEPTWHEIQPAGNRMTSRMRQRYDRTRQPSNLKGNDM